MTSSRFCCSYSDATAPVWQSFFGPDFGFDIDSDTAGLGCGVDRNAAGKSM
jgi:hypothetical protein